MSSITEIQKRIYNLYLKALRVNNNKPFRPRKDFKKMESDLLTLTYLKKLEDVFKKYPAFFSDAYFDAPYKLYSDKEANYNLKFFSSQKGISTCIAYYKSLRDGEPNKQHQFIKDSFQFVAQFCLDKGITLEKYTSYCSVSQRDCLKHLKEHKISWYAVFGIPHFYDILHNLPSEEFEMYFGGDVDIVELHDRYLSCKETVQMVAKIKDIIAKFLRKNLHKLPS
jgi:hypothetical protein